MWKQYTLHKHSAWGIIIDVKTVYPPQTQFAWGIIIDVKTVYPPQTQFAWGIIIDVKTVYPPQTQCLRNNYQCETSIPHYKWPRWLSWMRRPTGDQEVKGSTLAEIGNILSWRLIIKYFLWSFSPFRWFKKGSCQFLAKECAQYWLTA